MDALEIGRRLRYSSCCRVALLGGGWAIIRRHHRVDVSTIHPLFHYPPRHQTARTHMYAMASDDNGDFDTDLSAAPAKRMRYSFADEIAQSSHFEAFGQRFTGFPSGECYGKCVRKSRRADASAARLPANMADFFPFACIRRAFSPGRAPRSPAHRSRWRHRSFVFFSTVTWHDLRHLAAFPSSSRVTTDNKNIIY